MSLTKTLYSKDFEKNTNYLVFQSNEEIIASFSHIILDSKTIAKNRERKDIVFIGKNLNDFSDGFIEALWSRIDIYKKKKNELNIFEEIYSEELCGGLIEHKFRKYNPFEEEYLRRYNCICGDWVCDACIELADFDTKLSMYFTINKRYLLDYLIFYYLDYFNKIKFEEYHKDRDDIIQIFEEIKKEYEEDPFKFEQFVISKENEQKMYKNIKKQLKDYEKFGIEVIPNVEELLSVLKI